MAKLIATVTFVQEYGHSSNRTSEDFARKELTAGIERAIKEAEERRRKHTFTNEAELANWSFTGIRVEVMTELFCFQHGIPACIMMFVMGGVDYQIFLLTTKMWYDRLKSLI